MCEMSAGRGGVKYNVGQGLGSKVKPGGKIWEKDLYAGIVESCTEFNKFKTCYKTCYNILVQRMLVFVEMTLVTRNDTHFILNSIFFNL